MSKQVRGREVEEERGRECEGCAVGSMPSSATTIVWAKNGTLCEDKGLLGTLPAHFLAILYAAVHPVFLDYSLLILARQHRDCERAQGIE